MKQTIYVDVLLAVNLFINYFLLLATAKFLAVRRLRLRMLASAALGSAYSLTLLLPEIPVALSLLMELFMAASLVFLAFPNEGVKRFFKALACFYAMNFAFAGLMMALWYFTAPQGMVMKNSVVYFNISPLFLIGTTAVCYVVIRLIYRFIGRHKIAGEYCTVTVFWQGKSVCCTAKIDTGNALVEPFSHYPVLVLEYRILEPLFSCQVQAFFRENKWESVGVAFEEQGAPNIRMVPFQSVSGSGVLPAFLPEKITVKTGRVQIQVQQVYVAVCKEKITGDGFGGLLNPEILSQGKEIVMGRNDR